MFSGAFVCFLGHFQVVRIGSTMSKLCRSGYWGRGGIAKRLEGASADLQKYCKRTGLKTALRAFSAINLNLKKGCYPDPFLISQVFVFPSFSFTKAEMIEPFSNATRGIESQRLRRLYHYGVPE